MNDKLKVFRRKIKLGFITATVFTLAIVGVHVLLIKYYSNDVNLHYFDEILRPKMASIGVIIGAIILIPLLFVRTVILLNSEKKLKDSYIKLYDERKQSIELKTYKNAYIAANLCIAIGFSFASYIGFVVFYMLAIFMFIINTTYLVSYMYYNNKS